MVQHLIEQGLRQHRSGRLSEAKTLYEQALMLQPRHPDALHLAGVAALQGGDSGLAIELIQRAIEVQPGNPGFHANLAQACLASRRAGEALAAFRRAAALDPGEPQFAVGAANCLAMLGSLAEAERELRQLARQYPAFALAWFNLGNAVQDQGRHPEAADLYRRAIALEPGFADAHTNLGRSLHQLERFEEAEQAYRRCLALLPDSAAGHCNLASLLMDRGRFTEAAAVCEQGIERSRDAAELHRMLGAALTHQGRILPALAAFRSAARLAPDDARAAAAYGGALRQAGHHAEGMEWLERALALQPESPDFRHALAGARLAAGDLRAGWKEYESRPARQRRLAGPSGPRPVRELPEGLSGKSVGLLREQGLGDELFFLRFAAALKSRGVEITCHASDRIASMLGRVAALDRVVAAGDPLPEVDFHLLAGDLPHALGVNDYLPPLAIAPLPERLGAMKQRLAALGQPPYLGLTWRAGSAPEQQRGTQWVLYKAIPLEMLGAAIRDLDGTLVALQRHPEAGEVARLAQFAGQPVHDLTALNEDLEAMLALLALIDDYAGVSNTNMHLRAGAGRTARVLVPQPPEWRWLAAGDESPWFPGFRIYRQQPDGDWEPALRRLALELRTELGPRKR